MQKYAIGLGCRKGTTALAIGEAIRHAFVMLGGGPALSPVDNQTIDRALTHLDWPSRLIESIASISAKADEPGIGDFCRHHDLALRFFSAEALNVAWLAGGKDCSNGGVSPAMQRFGVQSVCEASALCLSIGPQAGPGVHTHAHAHARLLLPKTVHGSVTVAIALAPDV